MNIKGYKVFNPDWTCRDMQYEVGKTYKHDGPIFICEAGFHFCCKVADCFNYYNFDPQNKVAEVEATGSVKTDGIKYVTDEIKILREIPWVEMLELANVGNNNTGFKNTGDRNPGCWNTGDVNIGGRNAGNFNNGDWNVGNRNNGNRNTGHNNTGSSNNGNRNTGSYNTGSYNTGSWNTGNYNSGYFNTGHWNSGDCNTGWFSTITPKIDLFEKPSGLTYEEVMNIPGIQVLHRAYNNNQWICSEFMTDEEKVAHPEYKTMGGYLKSIPFKDACILMWKNLSENDKRKVLEIPNFDADIFYRITGILVRGQDDG